MGYILPITQHTYINYHARELEDGKSAHHIDAVYKVMFNKIQSDGHNPYDNNNYELEEVEKTEEEIKSPHHSVTQHERETSYFIDKETKAGLTGKGKWMNQQV